MFRCKEYRKTSKCPAYFKLFNEKIFEKDFNHNGDEKDCSKYIFKTNLKNKIKGCPNIFNVSAKKLFVSELANNNDNMPNFSTVKSTIYREINKKYPEEINSLNDLDFESSYTKTKTNEEFLIYKSNKIAIFQSEIQTKIMLDNCSDIFIDGTFFSAPIGVYQIIVLRVALENHHKYFTTSFALALDKKEETYKDILNKINNNIKTYALKHNLKINYKPKIIHCDMELSLINSIKYIWPYSQIKICYFHWKQAMESKRKKYKDILKNSLPNQETFKCLLTLPLIPTDMVD